MVVKLICTATIMILDRTLPTRTILAVHRIPDQAPTEVPIATNLRVTALDKVNRSLTSSKCDKMRIQITSLHSPKMKKTRVHNLRPTR